MLIPIQCEYYALEGLGQLLRNVELVRAHLNPELHVSTILLTMYDGRTRLASQVAEEVRTHFGEDGAADEHPAVGADLRGAELRADGDDLRPRLDGRAVLPGGGARDRASVSATRQQSTAAQDARRPASERHVDEDWAAGSAP